jgi:hypothetical protein
MPGSNDQVTNTPPSAKSSFCSDTWLPVMALSKSLDKRKMMNQAVTDSVEPTNDVIDNGDNGGVTKALLQILIEVYLWFWWSKNMMFAASSKLKKIV